MLVSRKEGLSFLVLLFCCSAVQRNGAVQRKQGFGFVYLFQEKKGLFQEQEGLPLAAASCRQLSLAACFKNRQLTLAAASCRQLPLAAAQKRPGFVSQEEEPGVVQEGRTGVCVFQQETRCCSTKGQKQGKGTRRRTRNQEEDQEEDQVLFSSTRRRTRCCSTRGRTRNHVVSCQLLVVSCQLLVVSCQLLLSCFSSTCPKQKNKQLSSFLLVLETNHS